MPEGRAVIFANGSLPAPQALKSIIKPGDYILAADGGSRHARALGLAPQTLIGDLDSVTPDLRRWMQQAGTRFIEYPPDKDQTDLELALQHILRQGFRAVLVAGALGGRLDQTLANLSLISNIALQEMDIRLDDGLEEAWFIRGRASIQGRAGDLVSLLPWDGPASGVTTGGLKWPLEHETLLPHKTRGVSNEMITATASVSLQAGLLLCIHRRM
ncbi:MAG: thiamine diphosphokinase [Chloroflexi bacterium]|nr:thiamine diphosphokinase [Chloroflexota bacterium]